MTAIAPIFSPANYRLPHASFLISSRLSLAMRISPAFDSIAESPLVQIATVAESIPGSIKLCYGESDMPTPEFICRAAYDAARAGHTFYTNTAGYTELRRAIALKVAELHHVSYEPGEILCTVGASMGIYATIRALVGAGDNAEGSNPQDRDTLAGKVLRIDPATGEPAVGNPFGGSGPSAYVWNYGHRNVQGLAVRPGTDQVYGVEQGTSRDDEVNLLEQGANYGYDPDGAGGSYDESVPMTDLDLPGGAVAAVWSSGESTIATCGGTFLDGDRWGDYDGLLLLGVLKGEGVLALRLADDGHLLEQFRLPELEGTHGRIRTVQLGTDGDLYVTTDNGDDDQLLRVTPNS